MTSQSKKTIIAALVTQIINADLGFGLVEDTTKHSAQLAMSDFPACLIVEGGDVPDYRITQRINHDLNIFIKILVDVDGDIDDVRDFDEAIMDAIHGDLTLGGTCISCLVHPCDPIQGWDDTKKYHIRRYVVKYRRTI